MAPEVMEALRAVKEKDGIPIAVQLDRAAREWLQRRGVKVTVKVTRGSGTRRRHRASTRQR